MREKKKVGDTYILVWEGFHSLLYTRKCQLFDEMSGWPWQAQLSSRCHRLSLVEGEQQRLEDGRGEGGVEVNMVNPPYRSLPTWKKWNRNWDEIKILLAMHSIWHLNILTQCSSICASEFLSKTSVIINFLLMQIRVRSAFTSIFVLTSPHTCLEIVVRWMKLSLSPAHYHMIICPFLSSVWGSGCSASYITDPKVLLWEHVNFLFWKIHNCKSVIIAQRDSSLSVLPVTRVQFPRYLEGFFPGWSRSMKANLNFLAVWTGNGVTG